MTVVVHCLQQWRHYLSGSIFTVVTDNVANTFFKTQKKLSPKQARWQEFLTDFKFEWLHRPGRHNTVVDALSRKEDTAYGRLKQQVKEGVVRRYWIEGEFLVTKGGRWYVLAGGLRKDLLWETHDAKWASHPSEERTLALLARSYYWPQMGEDVQAYVKSCLVFQMDKIERKKAARLLQPLPIPKRPWENISMDFITGFPKEAAKLFFNNVVKHFGLPKDILKFSTANHPQTDGQTKRINALLEEYLRHYVTATQKNWVDLLDTA
ncbi:Transposon Tf2-2 polyprotein [Vitis vinifera]|uniref:Transposon Tf2-2 polyprotein n=1 Tax=Vitis vinifera TaxID=29760 RepID=A0A438D8J2_VITVI|nr:Transposon Tf2-2 polyprotein [Vitis vinifera]